MKTQIEKNEAKVAEKDWTENLPKSETQTTLKQIEQLFEKSGNWIELD